MENEVRKLYVWRDALCDYTCGIIVAYATSEEEARQLVLQKDDSHTVKVELRYDPEVYDDVSEAFVIWGGG